MKQLSSDAISRLRELLNIHPGESRMMALVMGIMLLTSAGFTLGSTGIEALFFARYGVQNLPGIYMALGALSLLTSLGITALLGRVRRERLYIFIPVSTAVLVALGWGLLFSGWPLVYPLLWLGKEVINSLLSLVVWGIAGAVCDTRQSKRLFPLFNAGRILGSVLGGLGTGALVGWIGAQNLLLAWAGLLLLAFICCRALLQSRAPANPAPRRAGRPRGQRGQPTLVQEMQAGYRFVRGSALFRWVSIAAALFSVLYFSIALPFSRTAAAQYPDENALAGFLGLFNGLSTAAAFLASIFLANRVYARYGIMNAILALPVIYLAGFSGLSLRPIFIVIVAFRFVQMVWLSGMADSAYQAMFNAAPDSRRDQVRAFVDGVPTQVGTFIAGVVLLVGEQAFSAQQLALVGLAAAVATTFIIWRASRAYRLALVDSLRAGRPVLFTNDGRFVLAADAAAVKVALDGMRDPDLVVRRISAHILGGVRLPAAVDALVSGLQDPDLEVRLAALRGLARPQGAAPAMLEVSLQLADSQPAVRAQAIDTLVALAGYPHGLGAALNPMLNDPDARVRVRAAAALMKINASHPARGLLEQLAENGAQDERVLALTALAESGGAENTILFSRLLTDENAPSVVRSAAAGGLASSGAAAIPALRAALGSPDAALRSSAAAALGRIGDGALPEVLSALSDPAAEAGALLALEQLPAWKEAARVRSYAGSRIAAALHYEQLRLAIRAEKNERLCLLADSLQARARREGLHALQALGLIGDQAAVAAALDNLQSRQAAQVANALETLESTRDAALIRPLLVLWEPVETNPPPMSVPVALDILLEEPDPWLRASAEFAADSLATEKPMEILSTLTLMERVLLLRRVPLLADLAPADLQPIAVIAHEHHFTDGEILFEQGDPGDEMYMIVSGEVRVVTSRPGQADVEIARRTAGDVVGEMAVISDEPRIATLIAAGEVRAIGLERKSFESLLRERPGVSLVLMRVLCRRLRQSTMR